MAFTEQMNDKQPFQFNKEVSARILLLFNAVASVALFTSLPIPLAL